MHAQVSIFNTIDNYNKKQGVKFLAYWVIFAITLGIFFLLFGNPMRFLRAESGLILITSFDSSAYKDSIRHMCLFSYGGHYIPIAWIGEFLTSRCFTDNESLWFLRQLTIISFMGASIALLLQRVFINIFPHSSHNILAFSLAWAFCVQPIMFENFSWPFMAMQMGVIALAALSVYELLNHIYTYTSRYSLYLAALYAYLTLHLNGIGIATVVGLGACLIIFIFKRQFVNIKDIIFPLIFLSILSLLHIYMMTRGLSLSSSQPDSISFSSQIVRYGGLLIGILQFSGMAIWGHWVYPHPHIDYFTAQWPYGWAFIVIFLCILLALLRTRNDTITGPMVCILFAGISFLVYLCSIIYRHQHDDVYAFSGYFFGSRYLIFSNFYLLIFMTGMLVSMPSLTNRTPAFVMSAIILLFSTYGAIGFRKEIAPKVWPDLMPSQTKYIQDQVSIIRECLKNGKAIPNPIMPRYLCYEFEGNRLSYLEPILIKHLNFSKDQHLNWEED